MVNPFVRILTKAWSGPGHAVRNSATAPAALFSLCSRVCAAMKAMLFVSSS